MHIVSNKQVQNYDLLCLSQTLEFYVHIVTCFRLLCSEMKTESVWQLFFKFADAEEYFGSSFLRSLYLLIGAMEIQGIRCF